MRSVTIHTSLGVYEVQIGAGLLSTVGDAVSALPKRPQKVCILSDDHVFPLYGETVTASLTNAGFQVLSHVIPAGESSKCMEVYAAFINRLAEEHLTRSDLLLALGGGVVGDLCGFTAATYLRGIPYVGLPTSLLAMVDSSVGGKTAIDLPAGKNLCGAFYPPSMVLCDTNALDTLPPAVFSDGMAEVIKYGMLFDETLFEALARKGYAFDREDIIARSVTHKKNVVEADEFDRGERQLLNFGHTPAHGIEQLSGYTIPHGRAVAAGMALITRAAAQSGLCDTEVPRRLEALLERFGLPTDTDFSPRDLARVALSDKKRSGNRVTLVMPTAVGHGVLFPCPVEDCEDIFSAGIREGGDQVP